METIILGYMGGSQNYGSILVPLHIRCRHRIYSQKMPKGVLFENSPNNAQCNLKAACKVSAFAFPSKLVGTSVTPGLGAWKYCPKLT